MKKSSTIGGKKRLFLLFSLFLVTFFPPSVLGASAQNLSLSMRNASMKEIMQEIKRVSQYDFIVSDSDIADLPRKTISFRNATIDEALVKCLEGTGLTYTINDATIVILKSAQQQTRASISGRVTDAANRPLAGVAVVVKNTQIGVMTDQSGSYRLNIPGGGEVTLIFSFLGMETQEIVVPVTQAALNMVMKEALTGIQEVVVTGIFDRARDSYIGASRTITEQELRQFQGRNLISTIANIDPSFQIIQNNQWGSNPNRLPEVQIRGASNFPGIGEVTDQANAALNTPLIIMDGFETSLERLMDLDENEITSITILKDGSATALYGSRGANGVVVVTTKQPEAGKLRFYYKADLNIEAPDLSEYNMLDGWGKFELENHAGMYSSLSFMTPERLVHLQQYQNEIRQLLLEGVDTYWLSKPLRVGVGQNHNLKVEGGDEAFQYSLSLQYKNVEGVMKKSSRDTFNGGINLTYRHSKFIFRNSLTIGYNKADNSPYGNFSDYVKLNPYWRSHDDNGKLNKVFTPYNGDFVYYGSGSTVSGHITNPLYNATLNTFDRSDYINIANNFLMEWKPVQDLVLRTGFGIISNVASADIFKPADHTDFANYKGDDVFRKGSYNYSDSRSFGYSVSFTAIYNKLFAEKHRFYAGLSLDLTQNKSRTYSVVAEGFPDEALDFLSMAQQYAKDGSPSGSEGTSRRVGLVGNVSYAYKERYIADISLRVDGSSKFGSDKRFAPFWSVGVGWNIHNETFILEGLHFINRLKLSATYGITGAEQSIGTYDAQRIYRYYTNDNYKGWVGAYQVALGNDNLEWQKTDKFDVGADIELFNRLLSIQAHYYIDKTSNHLSQRELPYANGFISYSDNIGALEKSGLELAANVWLLRDNTNRISWSVSGALNHTTDKITRLSEALKAEIVTLEKVYGATPNRILREGDSQYALYVVRSLGIDPSTGKELFLTKDGEVTYDWNVNDRVYAGITQPKYNGNLSTMFRYKDLSLNVSFGFFWGGQQYNQTVVDKVENANKIFNVDKRVLTDRWTKPGDMVAYRGLNEYAKVNYSSRFVQDNSVFNCQSITLQYTMRDMKWQKSIGLQALTLTANTGELFYWTTIMQERGTSYPFSRQFSFSASLLF